MKTACLFSILFLSWICSGQDAKLSDPVTPAVLKQKIIQNHSDNNLVYTYADWCAPCMEHFPTIITFCQKNNVALYIIVLSKNSNENLEVLKARLLDRYNLDTNNLFNYKHNDLFYPKKTRNRFKNYQAFMAELLGDHYRPDYIYGWDIMTLMDQEATIKVVSAEGSYEDLLNRIKEHL